MDKKGVVVKENINHLIIQRLVDGKLSFSEKLYREMKIDRSSPRAISFIVVCLELFYKGKIFSKEELKKIITDGKEDLNIDAIVIGDKNIDIFDCSFEDPEDDQVVTLNNSIEENIKNEPIDYSKMNNRLKGLIEEIHKSSSKGKNIRLFVFRRSDWKKTGQMGKIEGTIKSFSGSFQYFNTEGIVGLISETEKYLPDWSFKLSASNVLSADNGDNDEVFLKIPIKNLLELKKDCEKNGFDLFSKNIRGPLDKEFFIKEIEDVVEKEPKNFHLYHNGITIVSSGKIKRCHGNYFSVKEPQIINGHQTVSGLYKKYKSVIKNKKNLSSAMILSKVVFADKNLTEKMCQTANTQTPINIWELRANDDSQLRLERYINSIPGCNYQYKRKNGIKKTRGADIIKLDEFAQWVYSAAEEEPADSKNNKKSIFNIALSGSVSDSVYVKKIENHFDSATTVDSLCRIGVFVRKEILKEKKINRGLLRDANMHIIAGLYFLIDKKHKSHGELKKYFDKIKIFLEEYVKDAKVKDSSMTNNKLFTKNKNTWVKLKEVIKRY